MHLSKIKITFALIACIIISVLFNIFTHIYDNKYYGHDVDGIAGVADVTWDKAKKTACLISGWDFYMGKLYDSEYFKNNAPVPDANVNIGEYVGFNLGDKTKSSHGYGTYRLNLLLDSTERAYSIDMPEIFSSYKLFVNGKLLVQNGNPDPSDYESEIIATTSNFTAKDSAEVIIQVADYDHYYSGIIYPPIFGETVAVTRIVNMRGFIANTYMITAFVLAVFYLMLYVAVGKDDKYIFFTFFCLSYLMYSSCPIIHSIFNTYNYIWYRIEDVGFMLLLGILASFTGTGKIKKIMIPLLLFISICVIVVPCIKGNISVYTIYGKMMDAYKFTMFSYIIIRSIINLYKNKSDSMMFTFGSIFFGICVSFDYAKMWYEPIVLGWGAMSGGFVMCILIGIMLFYDMVQVKKQNTELALINFQTQKYIDDVIHDLKSPLFGITSLAEMSRAGIEDGEVISKIEERAFELANRINKLSKERINNRYCMKFSFVDSIELLKNLSDKYQIIADNKNIKIDVIGTRFELKIDIEKFELAIENLVMNAIKYTNSGGKITLESFKNGDDKGIAVHDNGVGMSEEQILSAMNRGVTSQENHMGIGLSIVNETVRLHNGEFSIKSKENIGSTFLIKFM